MNILIVHNKTKKHATLAQLLSFLHQTAIKFDLLETINLYDAMTKLKSIQDFGYDLLIAAGGDGTVLSVINGLQQINRLAVPILILPIGTANDFAHEMNIYTQHDTMRALSNKNLQRVDLIACTFYDSDGVKKRLYANSSAGIGFLSTIFARQHQFTVKILKKCFGGFAYALLSFFMLGWAKGYSANIQINNEDVLQSRIQMLLIRKTQITGPVSLVPFAKPNSGFLDTVLFYHANFFIRFKTALMMLLQKSLKTNEKVRYFGAATVPETLVVAPSKISITAEQPIPVDLNGEFVGYSPCEFEVQPLAATFFWNPTD
jgi:diacylglycerol kinase (ATP)